MGLNSIHSKEADKIPFENKTKQKWGKCELLGANECRKIEVANGFEMFACKQAIKINGNSNIDVDDIIFLMGKKYKVKSTNSEYDNPELFTRRRDYQNFTGSLVVGLE